MKRYAVFMARSEAEAREKASMRFKNFRMISIGFNSTGRAVDQKEQEPERKKEEVVNGAENPLTEAQQRARENAKRKAEIERIQAATTRDFYSPIFSRMLKECRQMEADLELVPFGGIEYKALSRQLYLTETRLYAVQSKLEKAAYILQD